MTALSTARTWTREHRTGVLLAAILIATGVLYLWDITLNGFANEFYAAAVQAGSESWKAWFFGSFDSANYITVDKPAGGLWLMGLSARVFGFSSASMLVPQALLAVASAALIYGAVRRLASEGAGLLAAGVFALLPGVLVMFRINNMDNTMVFWLIAAAYFVTRALDAQPSRAAAAWLAGAGVALGFAFLCKTLEGLMTLPVLGLVYLVAARVGWKGRIAHLLGAAAALVLASGWWLAAVALTPASSRPYIGGSDDNDELTLALGYNGLNRLVGVGPQHNPPFSGTPGLWRPMQDVQALFCAWLIPTAFIALVLGLIARGRAPRTDRVRAALILWGGWLVLVYFILAFMKQAFHPYYVVAFAPGIAGVIGIGTWQLWQRREDRFGRLGLAALVLSAAVTAWVLLGRNASWLPPLRWTILAGAVIAAAALAAGASLRSQKARQAVAALALVAALGGPAAYSLASVGVDKGDGLPIPGPAGIRPNWSWGDIGPAAHRDVRLTPELIALLRGAGRRWAAAADSSFIAGPVELAADVPVMAVGGFSGRDSATTLGEFQDRVKAGQVRYYLSNAEEAKAQEKAPAKGGDEDVATVADQIEAWVKGRVVPTVMGNLEVYDLSSAAR